jgi:hypothetical protein
MPYPQNKNVKDQAFTHNWLSLATLAGFLILFSCAEESNPDFKKDTFTSVFDHKEFSAAFYPIDARQTPDGGYLILAERKIIGSNFRGTYLLKVDETGDFVKDLILDQYANPVGDLMEVSEDYFFFALDTLSLQGQLLRVDQHADEAVASPAAGVTFPSAASLDGSNFLLLSYNHVDKASVISLHNLDGAIIAGPADFSIGAGDDVEEPIMSHILRTGKRFPFQVGKLSSNVYFFNGFENYSFSLVFTDLGDDPLGVVHGQQDDGGFSAVLPLGNGEFAASRFDFGENYFLPGVELETNGPTIGSDLGGFVLPELIADAPVKILKTTAGTRNVLVFGSDTKSKQIGLFFYDEATGEFISSRYLGFSNPFEIASIIETKDEGIAVCGTTWLAGRFPRICLFKISKEELSKQIE